MGDPRGQRGAGREDGLSEPGATSAFQAINAGEGAEKREPSYNVGGNAN